MSPLRGEEFTGRTVEEAIERGLRQLGRARSTVDIEVLDRGKPSNMLGMGGEDARVLLSFQEDERDIEPEPVVDEAEVPRRPDAIRAATERRAEAQAERGDDEAERATLPEDLELGATILREMLAKMGVEAEVSIDGSSSVLDVLGDELDVLIGRGGENLVSFQQLVSAITSKRAGRSVHIAVDVEGYRRRREEQLRQIAHNVAGRVRANGEAVTLEPMLAYERRIVHVALQREDGVRTESVGIDPNRRVVVLSSAGGTRQPMGPGPGSFRRSPMPGPRGYGRPAGGGYPPRPGGFPRRDSN